MDKDGTQWVEQARTLCGLVALRGPSFVTAPSCLRFTGRESVRTLAMFVDRQPSNRPISHADRRLDARAGGIQAVVAAERLEFLGGAIYCCPKSPAA